MTFIYFNIDNIGMVVVLTTLFTVLSLICSIAFFILKILKNRQQHGFSMHNVTQIQAKIILKCDQFTWYHSFSQSKFHQAIRDSLLNHAQNSHLWQERSTVKLSNDVYLIVYKNKSLTVYFDTEMASSLGDSDHNETAKQLKQTINKEFRQRKDKQTDNTKTNNKKNKKKNKLYFEFISSIERLLKCSGISVHECRIIENHTVNETQNTVNLDHDTIKTMQTMSFSIDLNIHGKIDMIRKSISKYNNKRSESTKKNNNKDKNSEDKNNDNVGSSNDEEKNQVENDNSESSGDEYQGNLEVDIGLNVVVTNNSDLPKLSDQGGSSLGLRTKVFNRALQTTDHMNTNKNGESTIEMLDDSQSENQENS